MSPVLLLALVETFVLPPTFFTFRCWEALSYVRDIPADGPFYPNAVATMHEKGDLAPNLHKPDAQAIVWITDSLGFRNDTLVRDPDILLIGDSFVVGSRQDQSQTLSNILASMLAPGTKIYSMAPSTFNSYYGLHKKGVIAKPKMIIYAQVERNIPLPFDSLAPQPKGRLWTELFKRSGMPVVYDKLMRFYSVETIQTHILGRRKDFRSPINANMYFLKGASAAVNSTSHLEETSRALQSYHKYCNSQHIDFLYVPMPNKESVYYDLIPLTAQPRYLLQLDSLLQTQHIPSLSTLQLYNEQRKKSPELLYHSDDTHWNVNAVKLVATEITKRVPEAFKKR